MWHPRRSNQVCGNLGSPSSSFSHRYGTFSCVSMHYYYYHWLFAAKIHICGPTHLWTCDRCSDICFKIFWDTCFSLSSSVDLFLWHFFFFFILMPWYVFAFLCLFLLYAFLSCSPAICSTSNTPHPKQTAHSNTSICTPASTDLLPYAHTYTRSEGEVVTDVSMVMCNVLLAGQYLARTSCRPPAHQPLSEPSPPPRPLLPPSLPPSHAAASPHHQKQTSVWRPRRVRTLWPHPPVPFPFIIFHFIVVLHL